MEKFGQVIQHDWQNRLIVHTCDPTFTWYRMDFRSPAPEGTEMCIITEVDEFQHRRYPCDLQRMIVASQVLMDEFPNILIVFIRWNPDPRKIGTVSFNLPFKKRVAMLMRVLQNEAVFEGDQKLSDLVHVGLNTIYLHYDLTCADGNVQDRVKMINQAEGENAVNASLVRQTIVATM